MATVLTDTTDIEENVDSVKMAEMVDIENTATLETDMADTDTNVEAI